MRKFLLAAVLLAGCGDGVNPPTVGDITEALSDAFCERLISCGYMSEEQYSRCYRHNVVHLCELDETCEQTISEEKYQEGMTCALDTLSFDCELLGYGYIPDSCVGLF